MEFQRIIDPVGFTPERLKYGHYKSSFGNNAGFYLASFGTCYSDMG